MALSRHHAATSKPMDITEIVETALQYEFGVNRPLKSWLRSAQMLLTEGALAEQDGDLQMAYLYYYRHATLILSKFPTHPDYADPKLKAELAQAQTVVRRNLEKLERWKPRIKAQYERYLKAMERRNAERQRIHDERLYDERQRLSRERSYRGSPASDDDGFGPAAHSLNANDNKQLAVELAHAELRRRDATRQSTWQAGIPPATVASRRRGFVMDSEEPPRSDSYDSDGTSDGVREAARFLNRRQGVKSNDTASKRRDSRPANYQYPAVPSKEDAIEWKMPSLQPARHSAAAPMPYRPAKELPVNALSRLSLDAPPRPPKQRDSTASSPSTATPSPPTVPQALPSRTTFKPTHFSESGAPLRTVLLPPGLRPSFLNLAHSNTIRNLETCGILCATLVSNALFINHLVIPDQKSTSDTCDTTEEGDNELFDFCDSKDLLVCGWIHTHPSQTCFLSSRDLHTSSGYQVMMPEAIAIVCAPKQDPDWGIFRLTDPPGLGHILNCQQRSLFHPHSKTNLYTDAINPGHVVEGPGLKFEVVDLRKW